jgi:heptosyltransferase-2
MKPRVNFWKLEAGSWKLERTDGSMVEIQPPASSLQPPALVPKRILVIRLDRLGDVILSLPVAQALRRHFPHAFIVMMVSPACRDVVQGHPALNEVMSYDKEVEHRGWRSTIRFARGLRRHHFDTALILHPSNRSHWIPWLAGIPVRIGYRRKSGWLLTHPHPHRKQEGSKHEAVYSLELLSFFGIEPMAPRPVVPVHPEAVGRIDRLLSEASVRPGDRLVAIHPSASCISKRWMPERFAQVADRLSREHRLRVCLVAGTNDAGWARQVADAMQEHPLNLAGALSIGELAALLRRCALLISNDSGPVHVAAAVGTPVIDIFGRNQRGLSPLRWGPLGEGHVILHKDVGCVTCLAHRCDIGFLCLTSLSVDEVYAAAVSVLKR